MPSAASAATEEIATQVAGIQSSTQSAVTSIRGIIGRIGEINMFTSSIASAVEEQEAATRDIAANVAIAADGSMIDTGTIWTVIVLLGLGTFIIRFSFLGLIGGKDLPPWVLRHLRYTAVAVLPGLVAPLVLWPAATGGLFDAPRLAAALATVAVGLWRRNVLAGMIAGLVVLYAGLGITAWH